MRIRCFHVFTSVHMLTSDPTVYLRIKQIKYSNLVKNKFLFLEEMAPKKIEAPEQKPLIGRVGTNLKVGKFIAAQSCAVELPLNPFAFRYCWSPQRW